MAHIHEKLDYAVDAVIIHDGKVLLRKHEKYNKWLFPGGHIEIGEDPVEALYREVKEETGLEVEISFNEDEEFIDETVNLPPPDFINRHYLNEVHEHVSFLYVVTSKESAINPLAGEMNNPESFAWLTSDEVRDNDEIEPRIKFYCLKALEKINNL